jgi:ADP-ribose pyrophosphatase YjhB (NUDIX family)
MKIGLLIIQRAIEPGLGKWAFPGGFLELEDWKAGLSREIKEEINLDIHPADIRSSGFVSTYPNPNRVLLFGITRAIEGQERAAFEANDEVSSIYTLYTVEDVNKVNWAFPIHKEFALKFFEERI